ncbi:[FeFe] hydrogenase H-cluster radical SAM maturase HydG [Candidatus Kuenenbacteria bacterium]|nr:[FeFe] hydrogenase H-cluster radical SAM maturase HydG [Candidatus Kuenenbacteria bacterium]
MEKISKIINEQKICSIIEKTSKPTPEIILNIIKKATQKRGLELEDIGYLLNTDDADLVGKIFQAAAQIKMEIYGERLVFFAPLYVSSFCVNDCKYCGFHNSNPTKRKKLTLEEVEEQTKILINMGHKRLLLEFGEDPQNTPIDYITDVIKTIYQTKTDKGEIRRLNVNIAATNVEDYQKLKAANIGTYQLFQETYHKPTYEKLHSGPKASFERQLLAHDNAFEAGIDDIGLGVLFGLYDYKFEVLSLISHAHYLEKKHQIGPHTFSVPRWQPAESVELDLPHYVSEDELLKIIAILRLAVPYTGMIISTRESAETREKAFKIGISQTSAASRTSPGGYGKEKNATQFSVADNRQVDEVINTVLNQGLLPSFCTACYRKGRTGKNFMDLAKPGKIHHLCRANGLLTFKEYLEDFASEKNKKQGQKVIDQSLVNITDKDTLQKTKQKLKEIEQGSRDIYF